MMSSVVCTGHLMTRYVLQSTGVLLQVRELATWVQQRQNGRLGLSEFDIAEVVRIESVGMGDR